MVAFHPRFQNFSRFLPCDIFAYSCLKLKPIHNLFERKACNWFYVRLFKCSISERSIVFEWQNFGVSSIKFDYRTQSKSIERLEFDWVRLSNVRLTTPGKPCKHDLMGKVVFLIQMLLTFGGRYNRYL